jgi:hypothetical protein
MGLTGSEGAAALVGQWKAAHAGSYNVAVRTAGMSPISGTRFVRKDLVSVFAG